MIREKKIKVAACLRLKCHPKACVPACSPGRPFLEVPSAPEEGPSEWPFGGGGVTSLKDRLWDPGCSPLTLTFLPPPMK